MGLGDFLSFNFIIKMKNEKIWPEHVPVAVNRAIIAEHAGCEDKIITPLTITRLK